MRILLVEDERKLAAALREALATRGYSVDVAHDGEHALEYFPGSVFDNHAARRDASETGRIRGVDTPAGDPFARFPS